jgi:hypothetical protein
MLCHRHRQATVYSNVFCIDQLANSLTARKKYTYRKTLLNSKINNELELICSRTTRTVILIQIKQEG